jgi:hypothetical protein
VTSLIVLNVNDHLSSASGGIMCCHVHLASPNMAKADRGGTVTFHLAPVRPSTSVRNRSWHGPASEIPMIAANTGESQCQPMPAPTG